MQILALRRHAAPPRNRSAGSRLSVQPLDFRRPRAQRRGRSRLEVFVPRQPVKTRSPWVGTALAAPFALAAGWIAYSRIAINHRQDLPPAVPGERFSAPSPAGRVNIYADGPGEGAPLLLVHSVNAAASAYEVRPLYLHYRGSRPVYALDLPGFGFSHRDDRVYTPRLMTDAIHAATAAIRARHGHAAIDLIALSLSSEYAARAALEEPDAYRSLGLISPTGFERSTRGNGPDQSHRGSALVLSAASFPLWSRPLFDLLTTEPSIRFFLQKTWGSNAIDEGLLAYDRLTTHQPGAEHAVWSFLAGHLFADDVARMYQRLKLPVWVVHGSRGDFVDYRGLSEVADKPNWTILALDTGALPQFERLDAVTASYDAFSARLTTAAGDEAASRGRTRELSDAHQRR
jgi:pimeloyl-ACP methyl ester carboxylesterase